MYTGDKYLTMFVGGLPPVRVIPIFENSFDCNIKDILDGPLSRGTIVFAIFARIYRASFDDSRFGRPVRGPYNLLQPLYFYINIMYVGSSYLSWNLYIV